MLSGSTGASDGGVPVAGGGANTNVCNTVGSNQPPRSTADPSRVESEPLVIPATFAVKGSCALCVVNAGGTGPYRVQFSTLPAGYAPGPQGPDSRSPTRFVPDGVSSNVSLGLVEPSQFSPNDPLLVTSVYAYGDQITGPNSGKAVVVAFPYNAGSNNTANAASYTNPTVRPVSVPANPSARWVWRPIQRTRPRRSAGSIESNPRCA